MTKARDLGNLAGQATGLATDSELSAAIAGIDLTNVQRIVPVDSNISVPGAPTSVSATAGNTQSTVSFVAPTDNGGSTILSYTVISSPGNIKKSGSSSPITVTGLTNGTAYTFTVKAHSIAGSSVASTASGSITPLANFSVDYLVVAGGGGSQGDRGGAGGAGGLRSTVTATGGGGSLETALTVSPSTNYTVTVGAGATGRANGSNSVFSTITSTGGGSGGNYVSSTNAPGNGGCGGGGAGVSGPVSGGTGTANQGYAGGQGNDVAAGGGGGAGAVGGNGTGTSGGTGGLGGNGVAVSITGSSVTYAGGGGGYGTNGSAGGTGGGGQGSTPSIGLNATNGTANTGGGGGGTHNTSATTNGGSGIVILRWLTSTGATITVGAGLTADATGTDGSYSYKKFTAGTGNVSWS